MVADRRLAPEVPRCLETLRHFVRYSAVKSGCAFCRASIDRDHVHLMSLTTRRLVCVCSHCASWVSEQSDRSLHPVPCAAREIRGFRMTAAEWRALGVPVGLAFCYWSSLDRGPVALYPTAAGPVESLLPEDAWAAIVAHNPSLRGMSTDVEGLLLLQMVTPGHPGPAYFVAPVDVYYRLIGIIRAYWQGEDGGPEVWQQVDRFFIGLRPSNRRA